MQEKIKVLVVDDVEAITENLKYALEKSGYVVFAAYDGEDGLTLFRREKPLVAILDIKMPGMNGLELLDIIKKEASETLVIMLTTMGLDSDKERGLDNGADRYLVKETSPSVVVSNVNAMLRSRKQCGKVDDGTITHGAYRAVLDANRIEINSTHIPCSWHEFRLMCTLIRHPHNVHKRDDLLDAVYGEEPPSDRSIDQMVKRIRKKAGEAGIPFDPIRTIPTIGYQLGGV